jgi:hypothetical protein
MAAFIPGASSPLVKSAMGLIFPPHKKRGAHLFGQRATPVPSGSDPLMRLWVDTRFRAAESFPPNVRNPLSASPEQTVFLILPLKRLVIILADPGISVALAIELVAHYPCDSDHKDLEMSAVSSRIESDREMSALKEVYP